MMESTQALPAPTWSPLIQQLETVLDRQADKPSVTDRVFRILNEAGPTSLIAKTIAEAFSCDVVHLDFDEISRVNYRMPVLAWDAQGRPFLVTGRSLRRRYQVVDCRGQDSPTETSLTSAELRQRFAGAVSFTKRLAVDIWDQDLEDIRPKRWFWESIRPLLRSSKYLIIAAIFGNTLAVCVSLFALQVWDRVIPANSMNSLAVLLCGVIVAILFELILRLQRAALIDEVGVGVDKRISSLVFSQMLGLKTDARPQSMGSLAAQIREINQLREAFSSSMLSAAIDLPFSVVFLIVIALISPNLVIPIIGAIVVILAICLIAQVPLARLAQEGHMLPPLVVTDLRGTFGPRK